VQITTILVSSFLIFIIAISSLTLISNYDQVNSYESCKNHILCKVSASSNVTREDFPERDNGLNRDDDNGRDEDKISGEPPADFAERPDFAERSNGRDDNGRDDNGRDDNGRDTDENQATVNNEVKPSSKSGGGGCLIATAAFGSELSPEVQFLRDFRDRHILSTVSGSSFMNVFNSWYYSFSPHVADYERNNTWFQKVVKTSIYPLLGILLISEKPYTLLPSE
jgi:hypothetical protein